MNFLNLELLSKYRTQLMGIAILGVMWCHSGLLTNIFILDSIKRCGYIGVDIFLLLSGMGIFFSLKKEYDAKTFYKKRALRILPYYIPIVFLASLFLVFVKGYQPDIIIYNLTTLSYWLNYTGIPFLSGFDWYIPSLLFLYLITYPYLKLFKKRLVLSTIIISLVGLTLAYLVGGTKYCYLSALLMRIPIYFLGILCGHAIDNKFVLNKSLSIILYILLFIGLIALFVVYGYYSSYILWYGVNVYPLVLITLPLTLILASILNALRAYTFPFLIFLGKYSLAIYLLHERLMMMLGSLFKIESRFYTLLFHISIILFTFVLAYFYQNGIDKLMNKKQSVSNS